jgi:hypothetical protein
MIDCVNLFYLIERKSMNALNHGQHPIVNDENITT